jgi:hypothetical protein
VDDDMTVLKSGSRVRIGGDLEGIVLAVTIRRGAVSYEVAWWDGRTRHTDWLSAAEVALIGPGTACRVGFLRGPAS